MAENETPATAGLVDYSTGATFRDIQTLPETSVQNFDTVERQRSQAAYEEANFSWSRLPRDAVTGTLTGRIIDRFSTSVPPPDPNWSYDQYKRRLEEASKILPEEWLDSLRGAHSEAHFDILFTNALRITQARKNLNEAGWTGFSAQLAAEMLDPVGLALGIKTFQWGRQLPLAMGAGRAGQFAGNAAAGAAGVIAYEGAGEAMGLPKDVTDYLVAAGFGAVLGGAFGPIATNPATRQEAAAITMLGRKMMKQAEEKAKQVRERVSPAAPSQAEVERAVPTPEPPKAPDVPEPVAPAPDTAPPDPTPAVPGEQDYVSIVPTLQREGPEALTARLKDFERRFGTEAVLKEARLQGLKKAKSVEDIVEAGKKQILDRHMAALNPGDQSPSWEDLAGRMQSGWEAAAQRAAQGGSPEEILDDGLRAVGQGWQQTDTLSRPPTDEPPPPAEPWPSIVGRVAKVAPEERIPDDIMQQIADGLDQEPPRAPGRARQVAPPRNMMANRFHVADYEAGDGKLYRIMAGEENGLGPYRVIDVNSRKVIARDLPDLKEARATIPGAEADYNPGKAFERAQLMDAGMAPGPAPVPTEDGYRFRSFSIKRVNEGDDRKLLTAFDKDGNEIGYTELSDFGDGRWYVSDIRVEPEYRKGFGSLALMKSAEAELGGPLFPDGLLLPDGFEHWASRLPWVAEWYRKIPGGGTGYYSPRRQIVEIELAKQNLEAHIKSGADPKKIEELTKLYEARKRVFDELPEEAKKPENLRQMFQLRGEIPNFGELNPGAREDAIRILDRILPKNIGKEVGESVRSRTGANVLGVYDPIDRLVKVALANTDVRNTAWHEATHALRSLGLFTKQEWDSMVEYARNIGAPERYQIDRYRAHYGNQGATPAEIEDLINEEAVAHVVGEYAKGSRSGGFVQNLYDRIILAYRSFKQALGLTKWNTPEKAFDSVVRRMRTGEIAKRPEYDPFDDIYASFEGQKAQITAPDPPETRDFLQEENWKAVTNEDVPESGGFWRFDRAGFVGQRENPLTRLIGTSLLNDTVGKADHSVNPFSADLDQVRIYNVYMGEYNRYRVEAMQKWGDDLGLNPVQRASRANEFYDEVGEYVADRVQGKDYHPAVKQLGDAVRRVQAEIAEDMKNPLRREGLEGRPLKGAEDLETNQRYLWRKFDHDKVRSAVEMFGQSGMIKMVAGAIRSAQPDIPEKYLEQLSRGYVMGLHRRAVGLGDEWSLALGESNYERFKTLLREDTHLSEAEIEDVISRLRIDRPEGGTMSNLKKRVFLDESYVETGLPTTTGGVESLAFRHLLDNNVDRVLTHYARRASGRIALGRVRIMSPRTNEKLVDGLVENAEIEHLLRINRQYGADMGLDPRTIAKDEEHLRFAFDRIIGNPDPDQMSDMARWLRRIRQYNVTRLMGQVGFAQVGEAGTIVGTLGVKAAFAHVPGFRRMITDAGESRLRNALFDEIEHIGIGVERLHGWGYHNLEEIGEMPFEVRRWDRGDIMDRNLKLLERGTYELSGMSVIQQQQERATAAAVAQKIANMAVKTTPSRSDLKRMAQLGVSGDMLQRILKEMRMHADTSEGLLFGNRVNRLNLNNWTDLEARSALENAMFRMTRKLVQSGDVGNSALWMSNPIWQTIFQFRSFVFTAWANQFLYNLHMRDFNAFASMVWATSWAAAVRAMQVTVLASTRSDGERWKEKQLDPWELGKAGFSRAGWSSIIPMTVDTGLAFAGQPGQFNARTTGQASDAVFGSPVTSFVDGAAKGLGGIADSFISGRSLSQAEARQAFGILPFSNMIPMTMALSHLISDMPERAPRQRQPQF